MMFKKLSDMGAIAVLGTLYLNRVVMGTFEADGLVLTPEGEAAVAGVEDAPAKPAKAAKVAKTVVPVVPEGTASLESLLAE
jgi:hypothetical protein